MTKFVRVKDGDNLSVVAELEPSVFDPSGSYPALVQTFRVVVAPSSAILELVPLGWSIRLLEEIPKHV